MSDSNWADLGYATISVGGVPLAQRTTLDLPAGSVVTDDPVREMTSVVSVGGGGGGGGIHTQDCSGGGTVVYDGPSTVPSMIVLSGMPGDSFHYQLPDTIDYVTAIANESNAPVFVGTANGESWPIMAQQDGNNGPQWFGCSREANGYILQPMTGWTPFGSPVNISDASLVNFNNTVTGLSIWRIASFNAGLGVGQIQSVPVYATLNPRNSQTYGVTPPDMLGNPSTVPVAAGIALAYVDEQGWISEDVSGESTGITHTASYPNAGWNTQRVSRNLLAPDYGDTLIGPSATGSGYVMGFPNAQLGAAPSYQTNHVKFVIQCRVVSTSGSTEATGDMCTIVQEYDFVTVDGSMVGIIPGTPVVTVLDQRSGHTIGSVSFPRVSAVSGSQIAAKIITPAGFDRSTVLDIAIFTESYST